jgi:hypothetical protein
MRIRIKKKRARQHPLVMDCYLARHYKSLPVCAATDFLIGLLAHPRIAFISNFTAYSLSCKKTIDN